MIPNDPFGLAHWRRTIAETYAEIRRTPHSDQSRAWEAFRAARDELFVSYAQTPLTPEQRARFSGLDYYPYDPVWRTIGTLDRDVERETFSVDLGPDGVLHYMRVARVRFTLGARLAELSVFWIEGYGGGVFLPFQDATRGQETYSGGRYLYDTIKGADLGVSTEEIVLDFNYAYNPSCAYDDRWVCPLSPPENRLPFAVQAGEKMFVEETSVRTS
jgi:uncharacterized protein (DUF1684 family)